MKIIDFFRKLSLYIEYCFILVLFFLILSTLFNVGLNVNLILIIISILYLFFCFYWIFSLKTETKENHILIKNRIILWFIQIIGILIFNIFYDFSFLYILLYGLCLYFNLTLKNLKHYYVFCLGISLILSLIGFIGKNDGIGVISIFFFVTNFLSIPNLISLTLISILNKKFKFGK